MSGAVHVSMAADRGFEAPLGVSLLSMAEVHGAAGVPCRVSVLTSGFDAETYRRIEKDVAGRIEVEWIEVDVSQLEGVNYSTWLSNASLFRLLLPELLPAECRRTIYVDADTLIRRPLTDLWEVSLEGNLLGAVRDAVCPFIVGTTGNVVGTEETGWRELGLSPDTEYFNSGLLLLDLELWRREGTARAALELLRKQEMIHGDQDALNLVALGRWMELPRCWNVQTADAEGRSLSWALWRDDVEAAVNQPAIIHYTEPAKPWTGNTNHPYGHLWFEVRDYSSWVGWKHGGRTALQRAARRISKAAGILVHG